MICEVQQTEHFCWIDSKTNKVVKTQEQFSLAKVQRAPPR